ncbi:anti-CBASS protein Acb1 family protein, partial [Glaesserella parasuis]
LMAWIKYRDNNGIKLGDKEGDQFQQFDTTLSGLDDVIMTNYQAVSGASNVPVTKLLGTAPKGFSTGENEDKNYNQELESIQEHDLTEFVERHHQLVMKSSGLEVLDLTVNWRPTDSPTAKELAEINKTKADTYSALVMSGVVDGSEVRTVLVKNPDSGFHDIGNVDSENNPLGLSDDEMQALKELGVDFNESKDSESQEAN